MSQKSQRNNVSKEEDDHDSIESDQQRPPPALPQYTEPDQTRVPTPVSSNLGEKLMTTTPQLGQTARKQFQPPEQFQNPHLPQAGTLGGAFLELS